MTPISVAGICDALFGLVKRTSTTLQVQLCGTDLVFAHSLRAPHLSKITLCSSPWMVKLLPSSSTTLPSKRSACSRNTPVRAPPWAGSCSGVSLFAWEDLFFAAHAVAYHDSRGLALTETRESMSENLPLVWKILFWTGMQRQRTLLGSAKIMSYDLEFVLAPSQTEVDNT